MTDEERRLLRLENADATLAELVAKQDERILNVEQLLSKQDERILNVEQLLIKQDERISGLEESFKILVELTRSASERANQHQAWINQLGAKQANSEAMQSNSEAMIAALTNAQMRTEESLLSLKEAQANSDTKIAALADSQRRTNGALLRLAESQAHTDQKLEALIEIVRESRNGNSKE